MNYKDLHLGAIIVGLIINFAGSYLSSGIVIFAYLNSMDLSPDEYYKMISNDYLAALVLVVGLVWSFISGYVSSKIAKRSQYFNASIIGVIGLAISTYSLFTQGNSPLWYSVIALLGEIPIMFLGVKLAMKKTT